MREKGDRRRMIKKWEVALASCLIVVAFVLWGSFWFLPERSTATQTQGMQLVKSFYTDWVYNHSYRISRQQAREIVEESFKYPFPEILLAIFEKESSFNPTSVSSSGAIGLGQILPTPERLKQLNVKKRDLFDISTNVRATYLVFQEKLKYVNGNLKEALYKYLGSKNDKYVYHILASLGELSLLSARCNTKLSG